MKKMTPLHKPKAPTEKSATSKHIGRVVDIQTHALILLTDVMHAIQSVASTNYCGDPLLTMDREYLC